MDARVRRRITRGARRRSTTIFSQLSQEQIQLYREVFQLIDQDRDGVISVNDLKEMLSSLGSNASDELIEQMLGEVPGDMNFTSFLAMFAHMTGAMDKREVIINAITVLGEDGSGFIDAKTFGDLLCAVGNERMTQDEVEKLFSKSKIDDDGKLDLNEFAKMIAFDVLHSTPDDFVLHGESSAECAVNETAEQ